MTLGTDPGGTDATDTGEPGDTEATDPTTTATDPIATADMETVGSDVAVGSAPDSGTGTTATATGTGDTASAGGEAKSDRTGPTRRRATAPIRRTVATVAVTLVVALASAGWVTAKVRLEDAREGLAETQATLTAQQEALAIAERRNELTAAGIDQVQGDIDTAVADRSVLEGLVASTEAEIAAVEASQAETAAAHALVAAHSADMMACFAGVSGAVRATRDGDDGASADALGNAAGACSRTLAYATGARFPYDFPDPFVLPAGGAYFGYSTNSGAGDIQVVRSSDLTDWELVGNALPALPGWAEAGSTWAPAVLAREGGYVVYYTVREASSRLQCISRGVSSRPTGPFHDDSAGPLMCQRELGGSIDPSPFVDADGRAYLLWKAEGMGGPAQTIWSQELTADGLALTGQPHALISADRSFEQGVVEAPSLVRIDGAYHLVYAAANWNSRRYATAVASCAGPSGPCTKPDGGRLLSSGPRLAGPGGVEVFRSHDGGLWAAFHAFSEPNVGYPASRYLYLARVRVVDGRLVIDAST